jgi:ankyrin repeat protein
MKKLFFRIVIKLNELGLLIQINKQTPSSKNEYLIESLYNNITNKIMEYSNIDESLSLFLQPLPIVDINEFIYYRNYSPLRLLYWKSKYNFLKKNASMLSLLLGVSYKFSEMNFLHGIRRSISTLVSTNCPPPPTANTKIDNNRKDINFNHIIEPMVENFEYKEDTLYVAYLNKCNENLFIRMIHHGASNPGYIDGNKNSLLLLLCLESNKIPYINRVVIELIKTGNALPGYSNGQETALTISCRYKLVDIARELIECGGDGGNGIDILPEFVDKYGNTALMYCCKNEMKNIATYLINTGKSNPGRINNGMTALKYACMNRMTHIAIMLIKTGYSQPGYIDEYGCTPIIIACDIGSFDIAIELLYSGQCNSDAIDNYGNTALMYACSHGNENIALEILKSGKSNFRHNIEITLQYCIQHNLDNVYQMIRIMNMNEEIEKME